MVIEVLLLVACLLLVIWYFYIAYDIAKESTDTIDRINNRLVRVLVRIVCGLTWVLWIPFWLIVHVVSGIIFAYENKRGIFK